MGIFSAVEFLIIRMFSLSLSYSPSEIGDKGHLGEGGWKLEIYQSVEVSVGSNPESVLGEVCVTILPCKYGFGGDFGLPCMLKFCVFPISIVTLGIDVTVPPRKWGIKCA